MTYIPTKEELERVWFIDNHIDVQSGRLLFYSISRKRFEILTGSIVPISFYPRSVSDLENLIKMFTPS